MVKAPVKKPDLTLKFFQSLTGEENPVLTINVFPEKHGCMVRPDIFHGQYDEVMQKAKRFNDQGACVAHCINKTDLKGRKSENITEIRTLVVDLDGAPLDGALATLDHIGIKPHAIVQTSPGRFHLYIFVETSFPKKVFKAIQKRLNRLTGGDPNVCDITRVLRTPGSKNLKNDPFLVSILELCDHPRYSYEEIDSKLPKGEPINDPVMERKEQIDVNRPLQDGERTHALLKLIGTWIRQGFNKQRVRYGLELWNSCNNPPLPDHKLESTLESIWGKDQKEIAINDPVLCEFNANHFVASMGGKTTVVREIGNGDYQYHSVNDFRNLHMNRDKVGDLSTANYWLTHNKRRTYERIVFSPGKPVNDDEYNMYEGLAIEPVQGECRLFLDFIFNVICSGDEKSFGYLLDYLAHLVQKPYEKPGVAIVLRGKEGTGKGTFISYIGKILGSHYVHTADVEQVLGRFNKLLAKCIVLFLDEAIWCGDKKNIGKLKALITEKEIQIEMKGKDCFPVDSFCRLFIATNEDWAAPAGPDSRRFLVLDVSDKHMQDTGYFKTVHEFMFKGGLAAFLYFLLQRDISRFDVRKVPKTDALLEQKMRTLDPIENWLLDILQEGSLSYEEHGFVKDLGWPDEISKDQLFRCFKAQAVGTVKHVAKSSFCMKLKKVIPAIGDVRRTMANGTRQRMFDLPSLDKCRAAFQDSLGQTIDWEDSE